MNTNNILSSSQSFSDHHSIIDLINDTFQKDEHQKNPICNGDTLYYFLKNQSTEKKEDWFDNPRILNIRKDFPILTREVNGHPLVWLDNSATTQKPNCVIQALAHYYSGYNSNVHRGAHFLAKETTKAFEGARKKIQKFIGAAHSNEIVFVRGATEAINLVASCYGEQFIHPGDEIILSMMEHHSNILPWQKLKKEKGAIVKPIPVNKQGDIDLEQFKSLLSSRTKLVALTHVSNVLGTINPVKEIINLTHEQGAHILIDGAQAVPHVPINVQDLDSDFYVFSGHKIYGPTGIGVLYGKESILEQLPPWQQGGGMIQDVEIDQATYNTLPYKFEAGTGNIADAIALASAIDYVTKIGMDNIFKHEMQLTDYAMNALSTLRDVQLLGTSPNKTSVIAFNIKNKKPDSVASILDQKGIAVRAGHHCAQPILKNFGLKNIVRASLGLYNTKEEIDYLISCLREIK